MTIKGNIVGKLFFIALVVLSFSIIKSTAAHAQLVYSHEFVEGVVYGPGTPQYDDWISFRASLPESGIMRVNLSGSRDPIGLTCNTPAIAQQIADAMREAGAGELPNGAIISTACSGRIWKVGACDNVDNNSMLKIEDVPAEFCACAEEEEEEDRRVRLYSSYLVSH